MFYSNFDLNVTAKYGIVLENWPLAKFVTPSQITTRMEVELLKNAFESGATCFRLMPQEEWTAWLEARSEAQAAEVQVPQVPSSSTPAPAVSVSTPATPVSSPSPAAPAASCSLPAAPVSSPSPVIPTSSPSPAVVSTNSTNSQTSLPNPSGPSAGDKHPGEPGEDSGHAAKRIRLATQAEFEPLTLNWMNSGPPNGDVAYQVPKAAPKQAAAPKPPRKTRSDKGKPRKKKGQDQNQPNTASDAPTPS